MWDQHWPNLAITLRTLCRTRWTVRNTVISSILKTYKTLLSVLDKIQEGHDEYGAETSRLLHINRMENYYLKKLLHFWVERLMVQLAMLPDVIKTAFDGFIKKVTKITLNSRRFGKLL